MKFSIASLVIFTVFIALVVNYFRLDSQRRSLQFDLVRVQDEAAEMLPQIMVESNRKRARQGELDRLLSDIQAATDLEQNLKSAFIDYAEVASRIRPVRDAVSLKRVPTLVSKARELEFAIFVPEAASAFLKISLINPQNQTPVAYPTPPNQDWPLQLELPKGDSHFKLMFRQTVGQNNEPTVNLLAQGEKLTEIIYQLDSMEQLLFDLPLASHEFSVKQPEIGIQLDFRNGQDSRFLTVTPKGYDFAIIAEIALGEVQ